MNEPRVINWAIFDAQQRCHVRVSDERPERAQLKPAAEHLLPSADAAVFMDGKPAEPLIRERRASGAMLRAAFELTSNIAKAAEFRDAACTRLRPNDPYALYVIGDINDARHGHDAILRLFDEYPE